MTIQQQLAKEVEDAEKLDRDLQALEAQVAAQSARFQAARNETLRKDAEIAEAQRQLAKSNEQKRAQVAARLKQISEKQREADAEEAKLREKNALVQRLLGQSGVGVASAAPALPSAAAAAAAAAAGAGAGAPSVSLRSATTLRQVMSPLPYLPGIQKSPQGNAKCAGLRALGGRLLCTYNVEWATSTVKQEWSNAVICAGCGRQCSQRVWWTDCVGGSHNHQKVNLMLITDEIPYEPSLRHHTLHQTHGPAQPPLTQTPDTTRKRPAQAGNVVERPSSVARPNSAERPGRLAATDTRARLLACAEHEMSPTSLAFDPRGVRAPAPAPAGVGAAAGVGAGAAAATAAAAAHAVARAAGHTVGITVDNTAIATATANVPTSASAAATANVPTSAPAAATANVPTSASVAATANVPTSAPAAATANVPTSASAAATANVPTSAAAASVGGNASTIGDGDTETYDAATTQCDDDTNDDFYG